MKTPQASRRSILKGGLGAALAVGFAGTAGSSIASAAAPNDMLTHLPHEPGIDMADWTQKFEHGRIKTVRAKHS